MNFLENISVVDQTGGQRILTYVDRDMLKYDDVFRHEGVGQVTQDSGGVHGSGCES